MRVGLLGGTFNPVHNGHLNLAKAAKDRLKLDKVIFIPSYIPPHKKADNLIDAQERLRMIELAIKERADFEISRYEIDKKQISYTIDTVKYLKGSYPEDTEIFFLIGADSSGELKTWKDIDKLSRLCRFVVGDRPGFSRNSEHPWLEKIEITATDVSSSQIRRRIREGKKISGLLPKAVEDYIRTNNLYK